MAFMHMYFGAPGCGKSTYAAKLVRQCVKSNTPVYTNFPCKGALRLDVSSIGVQDLRDCLVIIDEAGIVYNNREFKSFPKPALEFFKLHRHYGVSLVFLSQGWDDCDKKIRNLCTSYFNMSKLGPFTFIRRFAKRVGVDQDSKQIIDEYFKVSLLSGGLHFLFRPLYYKMFDSWDAPALMRRVDRPWYSSSLSSQQFKLLRTCRRSLFPSCK
mgnify:CR=1 FL=1